MALIKCTECGNDVSEMAGVCPHCGNPIGQKPKEKVSVNIIIALVGSAFIAIAPLCTYVTVGLNLPGNPSSNSYNMWRTILSPEASGLKSGDSAGFFSLVPTLILILGIIGMILAVVQIVKKTEIKVFVRALVPMLATILFVLFETVGLTTFRETNNQFAEIFRKNELGELMSITKGIGFYLFIVGAVLSIVALFIKSGNSKDV